MKQISHCYSADTLNRLNTPFANISASELGWQIFNESVASAAIKNPIFQSSVKKAIFQSIETDDVEMHADSNNRKKQNIVEGLEQEEMVIDKK